MNPFPKIRQFQDAVKAVRRRAQYHGDVAPTLEYQASVKLHGTNAAVRRLDGEYTYQSRRRVITPFDDNHGFAHWAASNQEAVERLFRSFDRDTYPDVTVFGEWCGQGIQSGVAISQLTKRFVVFAVAFGAGEDRTWGHRDWVSVDAELGTERVPHYGWLQIDFSDTTRAQEAMLEATLKVEEQCPFGITHGVDGVGEGLVWVPSMTHSNHQSSEFWFKTKGEKHAEHTGSTKGFKVSENPDLFVAAQRFTEAVVTEARLQKGVDFLHEMGHSIDRTSTGKFIQWVQGDIKDECEDLLLEAGLPWKSVNGPVAKAARIWYFDRLEEI